MLQTGEAIPQWKGHLGARRVLLLIWAAVLLIGGASAATAKCFPMVQSTPRIMPASLPATGSVRITFLGHSSFWIETPGGVSAVTDYNGYLRPPTTPDIVTMNNAHDTHYTDFPDPEIGLVLRGWGPRGEVATHAHTVKDMEVWNVPTNLIRWGEGDTNGNSIFVFQVENLCIAHLGHLHHVLTDENLAGLGAIDVLFVPVDGAYTMAQEYMVKVIQQIRPAVIIPMHYFNEHTLGRFLALMQDSYEVVVSDTPTVTLSRLDLPLRQLLILPGI